MSKAIKKVSAAKAPAKKSAAAPAKTAKKAAVKTAAKKAPAKKAGAGLMTPVTPSAKLAEVVGSKAVPRTEIVKKIWDYIKANGLQDKANKRMINADEKLKPVFGKAQISMFELAKIVGANVS